MLWKVIVVYLGLVLFTSYAILSPLILNLNLNLHLHVLHVLHVLPFTLLDSSEARVPLMVCMRYHYYYL